MVRLNITLLIRHGTLPTEEILRLQDDDLISKVLKQVRVSAGLHE